MSLTLQGGRRYLEATHDYTRALALNSKHFKALYNRAFAWDKLGEYGRCASVSLINNNLSINNLLR